jgi:hypothetical protein
MPDAELDGVTVGTNFGTGERQLLKLCHVLVDSTVELGYNDHALATRPKDLLGGFLWAGLFLSPGSSAQHTRFQEKRKGRPEWTA